MTQRNDDLLTTDDFTPLDLFAGLALVGLLSNPGGPVQANGMNGWNLTNCTGDDVADVAYAMGKAMLAARERP